MMKKPENQDKPTLTSAQTDSETGHEGLDEKEDRARSLYALKEMYKRGLIPEAEYQKRLQGLESPKS